MCFVCKKPNGRAPRLGTLAVDMNYTTMESTAGEMASGLS